MNIGGFQKQSFVDYPGLISAVIFTNGCNLSCWYCHNHKLISGSYQSRIEINEIYSLLEERKNFLDAVVISGGEPTLQPDLITVIKKIKSLGFKVKLDTNGTNPEVLTKALEHVDYVAMDVKNSLEKMPKTLRITNLNLVKNIQKSIDILKNCSVDFEFRTTFAPDVTLEDIEKIGKLVEGAENFYLQTYNPQENSSPFKHNPQTFEEACSILKKYVKNCQIR